MAGNDEDESMIWGTEMEVNLFYAMRKHKPVGLNKNFHMLCIYEKLSQSVTRKITSKQIWDHLSTMYDMQTLHESEILPFVNTQRNFELPSAEFGEMMKDKSKGGSGRMSNSDEDKGSHSSSTTSTKEEKEASKRKRTRQSAGTPNEPSSKRRR